MSWLTEPFEYSSRTVPLQKGLFMITSVVIENASSGERFFSIHKEM